METIELSAALTVNERTQPVLDGVVTPRGVRLVPSALAPSEIFFRQLKFSEFDISEMSLATLCIATAAGPTEWVGLPIFTMRQFFHSTILVRSDAGIATPADLHGKRVGVPEYQQTRSVWQRGVLHDEFGVDARRIAWFMERTPERSHGGATGFTPPAGIRMQYIAPSTDIGAMLLAGELDATLHHYESTNLIDRAMTSLKGRTDVRPLFPDPAAEGRRYFAKTGLFPINHCIVVRRSLVERHPWLPLNIYAAFEEAKALTIARRAAAMEPLYGLGVLDAAARPAATYDAFPYGVRVARRELETIARYVHDQGLAPRVVGLDELFAASTLDR